MSAGDPIDTMTTGEPGRARGEAGALQTALARYRVDERSDGTEFRRKTRLLASLWREANGLAPGTYYPHRKGRTLQPRVLGSRLDPGLARAGRNFLTPTILQQVRKRLAEPETHQLIKQDRLWGDLLSSQPMCFNLFGELAGDLELATRAAQAWWPGRVAKVTEIRFEWSPGRRDPRYLGNQTAFDAVVFHTTPTGGLGFIGIETKYHERPARPGHRNPERLQRYAEVAERSGVFRPGWREALVRSNLQQIWLDHLLALSMLGNWDAGLFVLVYPAANAAMAGVAGRYATWLLDATTFEHRTLEELVARLGKVTKAAWVSGFEDRYLDFEKLRAVGVRPPAG
jgi:hypothetical protein